jgi:hypothetical protein
MHCPRIVRTVRTTVRGQMRIFIQLEKMALLCGFRGGYTVGTRLAIYLVKASLPHLRRTAMKLETLLLNSFFVACVAICVSTLSAMLV